MAAAKTSITQGHFGITTLGEEVKSFTLRAGDMEAKIITLGATVTELHVPDANGRAADVVLGYKSLASYESCNAHVGCIVGRVANRIAGSSFVLDGITYPLSPNIGVDHLHGGAQGFHRMVWRSEVLEDGRLRLAHTSRDGDSGYPGTLEVHVTYTLTSSCLSIDIQATTDAPTPVNLASHGYFNLSGSTSQASVLGHELEVLSADLVFTSDQLLPTGSIRPVEGTALNFLKPLPIGTNIAELQKQPHGGYDHSYALHDQPSRPLQIAARLSDPISGRTMELATTQPCLQVYTSNFLDVPHGGKHGALRRHQAVCLEAQGYPDAVHHPTFPTTILRPGEVYKHRTEHRFRASPI